MFSATNVPLRWDGELPAARSTDYRVAFCLFAQADHEELSARAVGSADLSVSVIVEALLRWAISAVTGSAGGGEASVTSGQLAVLLDELGQARVADQVFRVTSLATFFATNVHLCIFNDPGGTPEGYGGMAVPVPPALSFTSPEATGRDFASYRPVGPLYRWGAAEYAARFSPAGGKAAPLPPHDDPAHYESMAGQVFGDWCLMLTKTAVQAAEHVKAGAERLRHLVHRVADLDLVFHGRAGKRVRYPGKRRWSARPAARPAVMGA